MSEPTFLPLLNTLAVAECKGEALLRAWAATTDDECLASALRFVSIREGEHSWAFNKRMCELGFEVCEDTALQVFKDFDGLLACLGSKDVPDTQKIEEFSNATLRSGAGNNADPFTTFFDDTTIDPQTGELLGRYICEERDSGRRLQAEFERVCAGAPASAGSSELTALRECIDALRAEVAELRNVRNVA